MGQATPKDIARIAWDEYGIILDNAQAAIICTRDAHKSMDEIFDECDGIEACDLCNRGLNILSDSDIDGSCKWWNGTTICATCLGEIDHASCLQCEEYFTQTETFIRFCPSHTKNWWEDKV